MIFAKDELSESKRMFKPGVSAYNLIICSFACSIALALVFAGIETFPAFLVILFGAIWNFFCDFKKWISLVFSVLVGVLYAHFAFTNGLYVHAMLYLVFYPGMQFAACLKNFNLYDSHIDRDKRLTGTHKYYIILVAIYILTFGIIVSAGIDNQVFCVMDTISALMLGISAYLRNYRYREYFVVRYIALATAAILWFFVMLTYGVAPGTIIMFILYIMYLLSDIFGYRAWKKSYEWTVPVVITDEEIAAERRRVVKINNKKQKLHENENKMPEVKKKRRSEQDPQIFA